MSEHSTTDTEQEPEKQWFRCRSCGDTFKGKKHSHATGYRCFACGGKIETISEPERNDHSRDTEVER